MLCSSVYPSIISIYWTMHTVCKWLTTIVKITVVAEKPGSCTLKLLLTITTTTLNLQWEYSLRPRTLDIVVKRSESSMTVPFSCTVVCYVYRITTVATGGIFLRGAITTGHQYRSWRAYMSLYPVRFLLKRKDSLLSRSESHLFNSPRRQYKPGTNKKKFLLLRRGCPFRLNDRVSIRASHRSTPSLTHIRRIRRTNTAKYRSMHQ